MQPGEATTSIDGTIRHTWKPYKSLAPTSLVSGPPREGGLLANVDFLGPEIITLQEFAIGILVGQKRFYSSYETYR